MPLTLPPDDEPVLDEDGRLNPRWRESLTRLPWTDYTPVMSSGTGTLTSAAGSGRWCKIDRLVFVSMVLGITTNGTGATSIVADLPRTAAARRQSMNGLGVVTGKTLGGFIEAGATSISILNYDATYPGGNGAQMLMTGCYEAESAQ